MIPINHWGPIFWSYVDVLVASGHIDINYLESLLQYIPCDECRNHYEYFWNQNKNKLFDGDREYDEFVLHLHNYVNERHGKELRTIEQYREKLATLGAL